MTIRDMQERKRELGLTNEMLSKASGVPLSTVQKVLGGITRSPRSSTIKALEAVLLGDRKNPGSYILDDSQPLLLQDSAAAYASKDRLYTIKDIEALPEDIRAELIDGKIYYMNPPVRIHQEIIVKMLVLIENYISSHNGACKIYPSPFGVYLFGETGRDLLEPDLVVICNPDCLHDKGCMGAPDWVMEVISPSTRSRDYAVKLFKYRTAGVKEYWIVNPEKRIVSVYLFGEEEIVNIYGFDEVIPFSLFPELNVQLSDYV